jgi:hypothetical protein
VQIEDPNDLVDRRLVLPIVDVDPQQPLGSQRSDDLFVQLDGSVLAIGVEQPGCQAAQRMKPRRPAAATATSAVRYWSASMIRSWAGSPSDDPRSITVVSISIDEHLVSR